MKTKKIFIAVLTIMVTMVGMLVTSCNKNDDDNGGTPSITYVRVTDPAKSDSLLGAGLLGNLVAIVGNNLANTREIYFNDQKATLNPNFITNSDILVTVPNNAPVVITDQMKLVFANGSTLLYNFKVSIPAPLVASMNNEYVGVGDTAVINGDFFFDQTPIIVTFTGSTDAAEIIAVTKTQLQVVVPDGASPGPVTVATNFGETTSVFEYLDDRNLIWTADSNPFGGWWGGGGNSGAVVVSPGTYPPAVNNNFEHATAKAIDGSNWTEVFGGPPSAIGSLAKQIPDDAILDPASYSLKMEVLTLKAYPAAAVLRIRFGDVVSPSDWSASYGLAGPIDTKGKWQTITIPFNKVIGPMTDLKVNPDGYGIKFWFWNPAGAVVTPGVDVDISIDNVRVVPNK